MFNSLWNIYPLVRQIKRIVLVEVEGNQAEVASIILPEIEIRGIRFWFLLCSCIIASIGLNTNSAAVIIGGMLVSPLMGPILGLGFGLATRSRHTVELAFRNLVWAVLGTLVLSTLYFLVTPLEDQTAEILSRSAPTLLDLFVAVASGFVGVIALTARSTASIVPGVAIATAIMPPLCTVGYGISQGDFKIALGALYLFTVNALSISLIAFLLFKRMNFRRSDEELQSRNTLSAAITGALLLLFVAPLGWTLHHLWWESQERKQILSMVRDSQDSLEIVNWQFEQGKEPRLTLFAFKETSEEQKKRLGDRLKMISPKAKLIIRHSSESNETREVISKFKSSPLFPALTDQGYLNQLLALGSSSRAKEGGDRDHSHYGNLNRELTAFLVDEGVSGSFYLSTQTPQVDQQDEMVLLFQAARSISKNEQSRINRKAGRWLTARMGRPIQLRIYWELTRDLPRKRTGPGLNPPGPVSIKITPRD